VASVQVRARALACARVHAHTDSHVCCVPCTDAPWLTQQHPVRVSGAAKDKQWQMMGEECIIDDERGQLAADEAGEVYSSRLPDECMVPPHRMDVADELARRCGELLKHIYRGDHCCANSCSFVGMGKGE
jgi:hypothetical protein